MQLSRATLYAMQESIHEQTPAEKINFLRKLRAEQLRLARSWGNVPAARDMHVQAARSVHADIRSMTAVDFASSIDVDTTAEAREIAGDIATFGIVEHTPRSRMLIESGAVDVNGNLKPYRASGHKSTPMTLEELGDDGQQHIF